MAKVPEHLRVRATKNFAGSIRTATSFEPIVHVNINLLFQLWNNRQIDIRRLPRHQVLALDRGRRASGKSDVADNRIGAD